MSARPVLTYRDPARGAVRLVLLIAATCLGSCALITLLLCAPHVL